MQDFVFDQPERRVVFGAGSSAHLKAEVDRLGVTRAVRQAALRTRGFDPISTAVR